MSKKILVISYCFPPNNLPEAYLCAKTFLNAPGLLVDVISLQPNREEIDYSLEKYIVKSFNKVSYIKRSWLIDRLVYFFKKKWIPILKLPDAYVFYTISGVREILKSDIRDYDAIITWSQWHSVHLAALIARFINPELKQKKWIARFSDPWSKNRYSNYSGNEYRINAWLERKVLENADSLVFITSETKRLYLDDLPDSIKAKGQVIPHAFNEVLYPKIKPNPAKTIFRYLGNFYGERTPESLFQGTSKIPDKYKPIIEIYGSPYPQLDNLLKKYNLTDTVFYKGKVSFMKSLELMKTADVLINIDAPAQKNPFLSSKLIDYLGSKRPILYIGNKEGTTADLIAGLALKPLDYGDIDGIQKEIISFVKQKQQSLNSFTPPDGLYRKYKSQNIIRMLTELI